MTSALDGGEWSASRPCRFNPGEGVAGTHWIRDWVGPGAGLVKPGPSSPSLYRLSYSDSQPIGNVVNLYSGGWGVSCTNAEIVPRLGDDRFLRNPFRFVVHLNPLKSEYLLNNIYKCSPYLTGNTLRLHYKAQPVNAVWGNSRCLLWEPYGTHKYTLWAQCRVLVC
jgi:hypothetical protein